LSSVGLEFEENEGREKNMLKKITHNRIILKMLILKFNQSP